VKNLVLPFMSGNANISVQLGKMSKQGPPILETVSHAKKIRNIGI